MAKRIIWSRKAHHDRIEIYKYWNKRNKSNLYRKKLNELFKEAVKLIANYPEIGKPTNDKTARIKIIRDYLIIYEIDKIGQLQILSIWDSSQNPDKIKRILRE